MSTEITPDTRPVTACLTDLLAERARLAPDRIAVVHETGTLTFAQLMKQSQEMGAFLRQAGVTRDSRVGVFMEPSLDLMTNIWGILWAGGSYVPLSPEYPDDRIAYMMADAGVEIVLTQELLRPALQELSPAGVRAVTLDEVRKAKSETHRRADGHSEGKACGEGNPPAAAPLPVPRPEDLAYVIYTSGSTGKPKGVMVEHRSIVSQMRWLHDDHGIDAGEIILQKTPMSFDAAQWEILAPACGSTVVMGAPGVYRDPEAIIATVQRHGVTVLQCVPTLLQALLDTENLAACRSLRTVFSGGEALSRQPRHPVPGHRADGPAGQPLRPDRVHDQRLGLRRGPCGGGRRTAHHADRHTRERHHPPHPGPARNAGRDRRDRRTAHRRDPGRPRLPRPPRPHRRPVRGRPLLPDPEARLYRTGDLAHCNADGTVQFVGRADNQVKLRGYRVELDEIRQTVETHDWVRGAAVLLRDDETTGFQNLVAFVELNPKEAALMDQGNHGAHHQSKRSRLQVRAQLSHSGCRAGAELDGRPVIALPGAEATPEQRARVFARKTYRFYEGGPVGLDDILRLLAPPTRPPLPARAPADLTRAELGTLLRNFGQHLSDQRLLPKYAYASPGSLYATQLYLELDGVGEIPAGLYYYHPLHHQLVLVGPAAPAAPGAGTPHARIHFLGRNRAIEPVYRNNIREVLEIEAGHMVGLFEEVLPAHGLRIAATGYRPAVKDRLDCAEEDHYLGTFELLPGNTAGAAADTDAAEETAAFDTYVQAHGGRVDGLPGGLYRYAEGDLVRVGDDLVLRKHVIAINQQVYERAGFGISLVATGPDAWRHYLDLGRRLQRLQMNGLGLGFMSSGYSSRYRQRPALGPADDQDPHRARAAHGPVVLLRRRARQRRAVARRGHEGGLGPHAGTGRADQGGPGRTAAPLHAAQPGRRPGPAAAHRQRQDRHQGARRVPARPNWPCPERAFVAPRTRPERRVARHLAGGDEARTRSPSTDDFFELRRQLPARRRPHQPAEPGLRQIAAASGAVRGSDRRTTGPPASTRETSAPLTRLVPLPARGHRHPAATAGRASAATR